ncbi:DNA polymerase III subunit gamma/tau [Calycomorphotria hydatis]|uniref:DNA polymerase III subunit gamma/tau n=1 Tax=Calycomorphotria hydatis TaxID=2528027 RepID=A0A517T709_9PLAN|nr:DNA polymerase III subunit gamma/tau [Calycomorphotria hydatis]QDT64166.1 DNA polymerase III subunit tau [Calycomorphotria hydatis]
MADPQHYTVLARRYRPGTFEEVVGQEHVAQALINAIRKGRVAHAYLFTGARGVGKTSSARIFAKALNCPNANDGVPCNNCEVCDSISAGSDVDVIEIDGASNNGVEDVRTLRANVNVKAMRSAYKIYIIDEVHMLSKGAFNALLKTLEEPPPNVKFIFCTTEPNKVPDTIRSRCQRFDFGTVDRDRIVLRLSQIAQSEGVEVTDDALQLVARRAAGSMRDSQSLFDQLLAFGGDQLTADDVHRLFGTASDERLIALGSSMIGREAGATLKELDQTLTDGVQLGELVDQLVAYLRDLMLLASGASELSLSSVGDDQRPILAKQAAEWGLQTIVAAMQLLSETKLRLSRITYGRALVELALVRISSLGDLEELSALVQSLKSGNGAVSVKPASARGVPAAVSSSPKPQKKTADSLTVDEVIDTVKPTPAAITIAPTDVAPQPIVDVHLRPGTEAELLTKLQSVSGDVLTVQLQGASPAIRGPKHLEFCFPKSYSFGCRYFDSVANHQKLEKFVSEAVGGPVKVTCRVVEEPAGNSGKPTTPVRKSRGARAERLNELPDDDFLAAAVKVFDARDVRKLLDG